MSIQLDVSPWIDSGDSPDLAAFKQRVIEVAKAHSTRFHCGEYRSVLRELGVEEKETVISVRVTLNERHQVTISLRPTDLNVEHQQQIEVLLRKINGGTHSSASLAFIAEDVTDARILTATPAQIERENGFDAERRVYWLYTSSEGRVRHAYRESPQERRRNAYGYVNSVCGRGESNNPVVRSARAENRNCQQCESRSPVLNTAD